MADPAFNCLLFDVSENIATLTLNRPDRMNAFGDTLSQDLIAALDITDADDNIRAVIITGAGKAFSSGADLTGGGFARERPADEPPIDQRPVNRDGAGVIAMRLYESRKPLIAAVNGASIGMGATLQLAMDIRVASTEAHYGFVFARRGIVPEGLSTFFLPRLVGVSTAMEWCASGRRVPAQEALERGLVRSLHAPDELMGAARTIAKEMTENAAPVSMALTRQMMWRMLGASHPMEAHQAESRALHYRFPSADAREGVGAWAQKRLPAFPDKVSELPDIWPDWVEPAFKP